MASFQSPGSTPLDAIGLGNPADGAPGVTPPNEANYQVPNQAAIQQGITNLANSPVSVDQSGQQATQGQEQALAGQELATANGQGPNPGNLQMQQGLQGASAHSMGAVQGQAKGANSLAALRNQQNAQAQGQTNVIGQGAQTTAQMQQQEQQAAAGLFGQIANGQISGASQRLQADITNRNLLAQAIQNQLQLSQQQMAGSMGFDQASQSYLLQQRQDYIQNMAQQQANMRTFIGGVLQAGGSGIAGAMSMTGGVSPSQAALLNASDQAPNQMSQADINSVYGQTAAGATQFDGADATAGAGDAASIGDLA